MTKAENRFRVVKWNFLALIFLLNFMSFSLHAQETDKKEDKSDALSYVEKMPQYPGGDSAMSQFISENFNNPKGNQKEGRVYVTFVVRKNGKITDVSVLRGLDEYFDKESIRVIEMMPNWIPGEEKGEKVDVKFVLPISITK